MTYEEVLNQLDSLIENSQSFHQEYNDVWQKDIEALEVAKVAVKRQIPKEAVIDPFCSKVSEELLEYLINCPVCGMAVCYPTEIDARENYKYCLHCGQRIDWSEIGGDAEDWSVEE